MKNEPDQKKILVWKKEHDLQLLKASLKHGYGLWKKLLEDEDQKYLIQLAREELKAEGSSETNPSDNPNPNDNNNPNNNTNDNNNPNTNNNNPNNDTNNNNPNTNNNNPNTNNNNPNNSNNKSNSNSNNNNNEDSKVNEPADTLVIGFFRRRFHTIEKALNIEISNHMLKDKI